MQQSAYLFREIDSTESFHELGVALGARSINNIIQLPTSRGAGVIRKIDFEKGLHVRAWDINLKEDFMLRHQPGNCEAQSFSLAYIFSPDSVGFQSPAFRKTVLLRDPLSIILIPGHLLFDFTMHAGNSIRAIDITLGSEWLQSQFSEDDPLFVNFMERMRHPTRPPVLVDAGSNQEYKTVVDLHENALSGSKGTLYLKAKTLSLVSDFFTRAFSQHANELLEHHVLHQEKMLQIEKMLEEHFEKELPSLEVIARQAAISESTLKRHFKMMFGKSIYEYYLEKKMEYAKRLLLEKPLTVKEVAYRLGYEKTSNFIHIFKKFHSYSPGHLKKNINF